MKHPSISAVVTQQPVFQAEVLSRFERGKILIHATFSIFGVDAHNPILFRLYFRRQPSKIQPGFVEERATRVSARHPQHDGGGIYQRSKAKMEQKTIVEMEENHRRPVCREMRCTLSKLVL